MAKLKEEIIYHECLQGNIRDVMEWRKYRELTTIWKIRLNCEDKQVHIYQQREHLPIDIWR
jgi:pantothenate kinase-related protein Tda10